MGLASSIMHVYKKNDRMKKRDRQDQAPAGNPLLVLHQSGRAHPWRKCPYCTIAHIKATSPGPLPPPKY